MKRDSGREIEWMREIAEMRGQMKREFGGGIGVFCLRRSYRR